MPTDRSSVAFAGSSAAASTQCEEVSYEQRQVMISWTIRIRLDEIVNGGLRPDWFSRASNSMVADRRGRFTSLHAACQLICVTIIKVRGRHVGAHNWRPCTGRRIARGKGRACRHRASSRPSRLKNSAFDGFAPQYRVTSASTLSQHDRLGTDNDDGEKEHRQARRHSANVAYKSDGDRRVARYRVRDADGCVSIERAFGAETGAGLHYGKSGLEPATRPL
jgi:hypothetical protein